MFAWQKANILKIVFFISSITEFVSFLRSFCVSGAVPGGSRGFDRARGLQWDASSGPGGRLQKHISGGCPAEERSQNRYDSLHATT